MSLPGTKKEKQQLLLNVLVSEKTSGFAGLVLFCSFTAAPSRDDCEQLGLGVTERSGPSGAACVSAEGR